MFSQRRVPFPARETIKSTQNQKHLDELLDQSLEETFPASDPPAMLEPAPDSQRTEDAEATGGISGEEDRGSSPDYRE
jgi:hypothetical protein